MYKLVDVNNLLDPIIYVAVLDKDCTPHYFGKLDNAFDYIWNNIPKEEQYPEHWETLKKYNDKEECYLLYNLGWIEKIKLEDL